MSKGIAIPLLFLFLISSCDWKERLNSPKSQILPLKNGIFRGGVLRLNETEGIKTLKPLSIEGFPAFRAGAQIYQGLVGLDAGTLVVKPLLAERWEISDNQLEYTFFLHPEAQFYCPGKEPQKLTAQHVADCFKKACLKSENPLFFSLSGYLLKGTTLFSNNDNLQAEHPGIQIINEHTIKLVLEKPNNTFLSMLTHPVFWVYNMKMTDETLNMPAGTGPFYLQEHKEQYLLMSKNPEYWEKDEQDQALPYLDHIKVSFEKNKQKELNTFREGGLDVIYKVPLDQIDEAVFDLTEVIEQDGNIHYTAQSSPTLVTQMCGFNMQTEVFQDIRVRRAFNLAIDRNTLAAYTLKGDANVATYSVVPPVFKDYTSTAIKGFSYQLEEAKQLLAQAGYPNGQKFPTLTLSTQQMSQKSKFVSYQVAKMLRENLNITVEVNELSSTNYHIDMKRENIDFWQLGWFSDYPDPESFLQIFTSAHAGKGGYLGYSNATFDSLYQRGVRAKDKSSRVRLFNQAEQFLIDQAVFMPLFYDEITRLINHRVKNLPINPMEYRDLRRVYVVREATILKE